MRCSDTLQPLLLVSTLATTVSGCYSGLDRFADDDPEAGIDDSGAPGDGDDAEGPTEVPEDGELLPTSMMRLGASAYRNTVRDLFSPAIADALVLEDVPESAGWTAIGARDVAPSAANVVAYEATALQIATAAVDDPQWRMRWVECEPAGPTDDACATQVIEHFGLHLFRRPLSADEVARHAAVAVGAAADSGDFWQGLRYGLTGMLLSPSFTHVVEIGEPSQGHFAYTGYEIATRLSYLLWDTTPDAELLAAAASGSLSAVDGIDRQVDRMLADDERVADGVRAFSYDLLQLASLDRSLVDASAFPAFSSQARGSMKEATLRTMVDMALHDDREFLAVLEAGFTYADGNLADYYEGIAPDAPMQRIELPTDGPRVGLLTEPSLLAATSGSRATSPTRRGRFVFARMLCAVVPPPPPDVANDLPSPPTGTTRREQLEQHMEDPSCAACHRHMDPLGFALESFDPVGMIQLEDGGKPIDTTGELDGVTFDGARSLSTALLEHEDLRSCFAKQLYSYATGARARPEQQWIVDRIATTYRESGGDIVAVWRDLVRSDAFRFGFAPRE